MNEPAGKILAQQIRDWGQALGFSALGIADIDLARAEKRLQQWLARGFQGDMGYMSAHGTRRTRPDELVAGTCRVITARMDYLPQAQSAMQAVLDNPQSGYISRYALGRDYHKLIRKRLQKLADRITARVGPHGYRVFCDSAPVLEKALAEKSGLGWMGKHSNILHRDGGSWFFLGEIYTDLPLPPDRPVTAHCGRCTACMDICPTRAIVEPYIVDARRCISYLTIEHHGAIPEHLRPAIGNRIYGCDDCQLVCPWNRYARLTGETDFHSRHGLEAPNLVDLFNWSREIFRKKTEGSAIRRIGYTRWLRNIAVALGNAPTSSRLLDALRARMGDRSALVREHTAWALKQHGRF